jgi:uncharacterized membrane protein (TIGR02234 family)
MTAPAGAEHRRELTAAMAGSALAGGLALMASAQTWVEVTVLRAAPLPATTDELSGGEAVPLVPAMGLLLLAAALALLAVRGSGRVAVGAIAALAGAVLVWSGLDALLVGASPDAGRLARLVSPGDPDVQTEESVLWPVLATLAGLVALATGGLVAVRGRRWPGPSRRYERAATAGGAAGAGPVAPRPATDEDRAQAAWTALDRGEDPTDGPGTPPGRP